MKIKLFIILGLIIFSGISSRVFSQEYTSGFFVPMSASINEETRSLLENKIKVALSEAGITPYEGYYPVVTCVKYDEIEAIEVPGIRTVYKTVGNVSLILMMEKSKKLVSAKSYKVEGSGTSLEIAQRNAIDQIEIPESEIKALFSKAKSTYKKEVAKMPKTSASSKTGETKASGVEKTADKQGNTNSGDSKTSTGSKLSESMHQSRSEVNESYQKLFNKLFKK